MYSPVGDYYYLRNKDDVPRTMFYSTSSILDVKEEVQNYQSCLTILSIEMPLKVHNVQETIGP